MQWVQIDTEHTTRDWISLRNTKQTLMSMIASPLEFINRSVALIPWFVPNVHLVYHVPS